MAQQDQPSGSLANALDLENIGLSIDMLYADRLRDWARLLLVHGPDITHWGSVPFVVSKMQAMATDIEKAVRDIGILRAEVRAFHELKAAAERLARFGESTGASPWT